MTYAETDLLATIDGLLEPTDRSAPLGPDALDALDQFHSGGSAAVDRLVATLRPVPGDVVLDIGSGLGGPARQVAVATGCEVVGVDITAAYVEAAVALSARSGLSDRVRFVHADIEALDAGAPFDAGFTMHVQMNVADKAAWFGAIAARLAPGAPFAVWEVCRTGDGRPPWPMPWSMDGTDSFLVTPDELRVSIERGGFDTVEWVDESDWVRTWFDATFADGPPTRPSIPMLLDDGFTRVLQFAGALVDGTLQIRRGAFVRAAG
jgi:SAM-dependent methyltransferase